MRKLGEKEGREKEKAEKQKWEKKTEIKGKK